MLCDLRHVACGENGTSQSVERDGSPNESDTDNGHSSSHNSENTKRQTRPEARVAGHFTSPRSVGNSHHNSKCKFERLARVPAEYKVHKWRSAQDDAWMAAWVMSVASSCFDSVNSKPPIQQNSMKNGYDENHNYNKSDETKCATNYSFITNNNKWNMNTHNNMQLTKHDTNDDVDFNNCVVHTVR